MVMSFSDKIPEDGKDSLFRHQMEAQHPSVAQDLSKTSPELDAKSTVPLCLNFRQALIFKTIIIFRKSIKPNSIEMQTVNYSWIIIVKTRSQANDFLGLPK